MNEKAYILAPEKSRGVDLFYSFSILEYEYEPIVFVAKDKENNDYLCDCVEFRFGKQIWTIAKTTKDTLKRLVRGQISTYEALKENGSAKILAEYDYETKTFSQRIINFNDIDEKNLPKKGAIIHYPCDNAMENIEVYCSEAEWIIAAAQNTNSQVNWAGFNGSSFGESFTQVGKVEVYIPLSSHRSVAA